LTPAPTRLTLPEALQRAVSAYQSGQLADAQRLCELILQADPAHIDAVNVLGAVALRRGDAEGALAHFTRAAQLQPRFAEAHSNRGVALLQLRRWNEALDAFRRALMINPRHLDALFNHAIVLGELERWPEALESYEQLLRLRADHALAWSNRGNALQKLERFKDAIASYDRAISLRADYVDAIYNRATALHKLNRWEEALAGYDAALRLRADHADALNNRAAVLHELGRWDEALAGYDQALRLRPEYAEAHSNRAGVLQELGRFEEAAAAFERAMRANPDYFDGRWNQGLLFLLMGDCARGWPPYELRWQLPEMRKFAPGFTQPLWLGKEDLAGKTILLHAEQGLGDTIQFSRYVPRVEAIAGHVILDVQPALTALLATISPRITVIARGEAPPPFDYHCPLGSLPLAFGTTLETIPPPAPLHVPGEKIAEWRARLGKRTRPRVGIAWAGNPENPNDRRRSSSLARFLPLLEEDRFEFHSLQKELREGDRELLARYPELRPWGDELDDFTDTAALLMNLDLFVSIDTSVAHLAATLGRPVWFLLTKLADWRYLLERGDTPWYPGARLFRQPRQDDWDAVVAEARAALRESVFDAVPVGGPPRFP
jgi:tetratricopeptide (TPR) repeat protein